MDTKFLKTLLLFIGSCLWVSCTDEEQSNDNPQETISNEISGITKAINTLINGP